MRVDRTAARYVVAERNNAVLDHSNRWTIEGRVPQPMPVMLSARGTIAHSLVKGNPSNDHSSDGNIPR